MKKIAGFHLTTVRLNRFILGLLLVGGTFWLAACGGNDSVPPSVVSVVIAQGDQTLEVGGDVTLTADVTVLGAANRDVTWSISDSSIATVTTAGLVTAIAEGTATITATSVGLPERSASVTVTVVPAGQTPGVVSVVIPEGDQALEVGDDAPLTAVVTVFGEASQAVTWSSSDDSTATVSTEGLVTAVAEGSATITATSVGLPERTASVTITVVPVGQTPVVVSVAIPEGDQVLEVGDIATLTAVVIVFDGASQDVTWSSSDSSIATVTTAGVVTAVAEGSATITATTVGMPQKTAAVIIKVDPAGQTPSVVSVVIPEGDQALEVGDDVTLTADVTVVGEASQAVTWSSSANSVASVTPAGVVTAVAEGTATITATSVGLPERTASITVTVTEAAQTDLPVITSFAGSVVAGSQAQLTWAVTNASSLSLYSVNPADDTDIYLIATYTGADTGVTVPLADSTHQAYRLDATNAAGTASQDLAPLANVVVTNQDYDVYNLRGWVSEPSIPGSLRAVLASAPADSVIGFASDIDEVTVRGVDIVDVGGSAIDAHLILRNDVIISGPVSAPVRLQGVSAFRADDPGDPFTYESRMVYVPVGVTATLENVEITGGTFIYTGAGIHNAGTLTVRSSTITGNRAFGSGGAVRNLEGATLTMIDSIISDNEAVTLDSEINMLWEIRGSDGDPAQFPGVNGWGGGLANDGTATLTNVQVTGNTARQSGGGIYNLAVLTLTSAEISNNVADHVATYTESGDDDNSDGGGIANYGTLTFTDGTISGNLAANQGGGLLHSENALSTLSGVNITTNTAGVPPIPGYGGGIMHRYYTGEVDHLISTGVTLSGNTPEDVYESHRGIRPAALSARDGTAGPATLPPGVRLDEPKFR